MLSSFTDTSASHHLYNLHEYGEDYTFNPPPPHTAVFGWVLKNCIVDSIVPLDNFIILHPFFLLGWVLKNDIH